MPIYSTHIPKHKLILTIWLGKIALAEWVSYMLMLIQIGESINKWLALVGAVGPRERQVELISLGKVEIRGKAEGVEIWAISRAKVRA